MCSRGSRTVGLYGDARCGPPLAGLERARGVEEGAEGAEGMREEKESKRGETSVATLSTLPIYHTGPDFFLLVINSGIGDIAGGKKSGTNKLPLVRSNRNSTHSRRLDGKGPPLGSQCLHEFFTSMSMSCYCY